MECIVHVQGKVLQQAAFWLRIEKVAVLLKFLGSDRPDKIVKVILKGSDGRITLRPALPKLPKIGLLCQELRIFIERKLWKRNTKRRRVEERTLVFQHLSRKLQGSLVHRIFKMTDCCCILDRLLTQQKPLYLHVSEGPIAVDRDVSNGNTVRPRVQEFRTLSFFQFNRELTGTVVEVVLQISNCLRIPFRVLFQLRTLRLKRLEGAICVKREKMQRYTFRRRIQVPTIIRQLLLRQLLCARIQRCLNVRNNSGIAPRVALQLLALCLKLAELPIGIKREIFKGDAVRCRVKVVGPLSRV
ncbi:hypothetical protein DQ04_07681010 [Trypanosoma grayi]|uniref:hypothetical protein n=1 Tax=Trypanosoma grayi TaxID=71804 RepID=UPI0004F42604|nr:hypothetical protein DQ04_07681010 [Trypanosoma grayi]KEG08225.1 hypothetical protein DQ04_07681010 [Trypanosoma grayi]